MSKIEWTEETWNPIVGCSIKSPGCTNCYAMKDAWRKGFNPLVPQYEGLTKMVNGSPVWTGMLRKAPEHGLLKPLKRRKPTMYFVNSMSDLFHEDIPDDWIDQVFAVMALCPQHTFQVLTKRSDRMRAYFDGCDLMKDVCDFSRPWRGLTHWHRRDGVAGAMEKIGKAGFAKLLGRVGRLPLPNVWLGVSAERQQEADERIPHLLLTPAAVRFISAEPLLGHIDLMMLKSGNRVYDAVQGCIGISIGDGEYDGAHPCAKLDWVIVGGESGPDARPMHPDWARSLRDQCRAAGVAFFFKRWGANLPGELQPPLDADPATPWRKYPDGSQRWTLDELGIPRGELPRVAYIKAGKKAAGRLLDGCEYSAMPEVRP